MCEVGLNVKVEISDGLFAVLVVAVVVGVMPVLCSRATAAQPQPLPGVIAGYLGHHVATERYALGNPIVGVDRFEKTDPPKKNSWRRAQHVGSRPHWPVLPRLRRETALG